MVDQRTSCQRIEDDRYLARCNLPRIEATQYALRRFAADLFGRFHVFAMPRRSDPVIALFAAIRFRNRPAEKTRARAFVRSCETQRISERDSGMRLLKR